jgi:cytochrome P450
MDLVNEETRPRQAPEAVPYDLFSQAFLADPLPTFGRMRAEQPVYWHPLLHGWVLTRYDDIHGMLRDRRFSSARTDQFASSAPPHMQEQLAVCNRFMSLWMVFLDPPRHTVLRSLVTKAFTVNVVEGLRPFVERVVDDVLDVAVAAGKMDVVTDLASPLPAVVIGRMLGVPSRDLGRFKSWTNDVFSLITVPVATEEVITICHRGVTGLLGYFRDLIQARRADLGDDLLSLLITAEEKGAVLTEEELVATCAMLLIAGHETTTHLISNAVLALLRHPAQLAELRAHPELLPGAVEELLRFDGASMVFVRRALEDVNVGGQRVEAGQFLFAAIHAGNHDPAQFPEPDRLDLRRKDVRHLGFGQGVHYCLGAPLARLETQVALGKILARLPELRLASEKLEWIPSIGIHGLVSLPVTFQAHGEEQDQAPASLRDVDLPPSVRPPPSIPPASSRRVPSVRYL